MRSTSFFVSSRIMRCTDKLDEARSHRVIKEFLRSYVALRGFEMSFSNVDGAAH